MTDSLGIENYEIVNDLLIVSFSDKTEAMVSLELLRQKCPCASCEGETDALGNLYKGPEQVLNPSSFQISGLQPVGYYGLWIKTLLERWPYYWNFYWHFIKETI